MALNHIPDEVFLVFRSLTDWEAENEENLYSEFFEPGDVLLMLFEIMKAFKIGNPPNLETETRDWGLYILNIFIEYANDFGINNIKSIVKMQDRQDIADKFEVYEATDPGTWPINQFSWHQNILNLILNPE